MATKKTQEKDKVSAKRAAAPKRAASPKRAAAPRAKPSSSSSSSSTRSPSPTSSSRPAKPTGPRIRASHGRSPDKGPSRSAEPAAGAARRPRALPVDKGPSLRARASSGGSVGPASRGPASRGPASPGLASRAPASRAPASRRTPLAAPKRADRGERSERGGRAKGDDAEARKKGAEDGPSSAARALALALAGAAIDKKAVGIEILDVTGKVDYADFLVVMTGRSDRHVHAIATGIDEAMRSHKHAPLSMEGLSAAIWVLIDFGDVVVHVFQEDARALYDIEGLWIDASRIPVPEGAPDGVSGRGPESSDAVRA